MPALAGTPSTVMVNSVSGLSILCFSMYKRFARGVEHSDVDPIRQRHFLFLAEFARFDLPGRYFQLHLVFSILRGAIAGRKRAVFVQRDRFEHVVDDVGVLRRARFCAAASISSTALVYGGS